MKTCVSIFFLVFAVFFPTTAHALICQPFYYVKGDAVIIEFNTPLSIADAKTFKALGNICTSYYAKDKNHAYYKGNIIANADPESFSADSGDLANDKNQVYWKGGAAPDATEQKFEDLSYAYYGGAVPLNYWKNSQHVYLGVKMIVGADPESFVMATNPAGQADKKHYWKDGNSFVYAKDKMHAYWQDQQITGADPATFESFTVPNLNMINASGLTYRMSENYAKDATHVFWHEKIISHADPSTFKIIDDGSFSSDKNNSYFQDQGSPLGASKQYGKTRVIGQNVYYNNQPLQGVDFASWEKLPFEYSRDKNSVYRESWKVDQFDRTTFQVINRSFMRDKSGNYTHEFVGFGRVDRLKGLELETINPDTDPLLFEICTPRYYDENGDLQYRKIGTALPANAYPAGNCVKDKNNLYFIAQTSIIPKDGLFVSAPLNEIECMDHYHDIKIRGTVYRNLSPVNIDEYKKYKYPKGPEPKDSCLTLK